MVIKKDVDFIWEEAQEKLFSLIKKNLYDAPVLALPKFYNTFKLECDALWVSIGIVLIQNKRLITYFIKKMNSLALNYPTYDKEL